MGKKKKKYYKRKPFFINRTFWVVLILLIQLALIVALPVLIELLDWPAIVYLAYLAWVLVSFVLSVIFVIRIIKSELDPEFKIPWLVVLLVLPGVGVVFYIIFRQRSLKRKQRKTLAQIRKSYEPFFKDKTDTVCEDGSYDLPIDFLTYTSDFLPHRNNKITYFECGEKFFPDFVEKLKEAKEFIFMEFFIIHHGIEWQQIHAVLAQKAKEGVEVRLLYDDFGCLTTLDRSYIRVLRKEGIKAYRFNKVGVILSGTYNNRTHRKIAVIDHKYAYVGGMNLGDEYANDIKRFGYWKDTMIRIEGSAINNLIALFLTNYDLNICKVSDYAKYLDYDYPKFESDAIVFPFGTGPENVYSVRVGEQNFVNIIDSAKEYVYISTPYLIPSLDLISAIKRACYRNIDVRIIIPGTPDKKLVFLAAKYYSSLLLKSGAKIYFYTPGFNHMKSCIADGRVAFVGTINMDYRSLVHHYECGATIMGGETMSEIKADFDKMLSESTQLPAEFKLTKRQRFICALMKLFMPLM